MAGVLEIVQIWMPGRHARLQDFVVDVIASIGFVIVAGLSQAPARA
jgi:VanZ family protein